MKSRSASKSGSVPLLSPVVIGCRRRSIRMHRHGRDRADPDKDGNRGLPQSPFYASARSNERPAGAGRQSRRLAPIAAFFRGNTQLRIVALRLRAEPFLFEEPAYRLGALLPLPP